jgi:hypothetical protein
MLLFSTYTALLKQLFQIASPSGRTVWGEGIDRLDPQIVGSNPA